MKNWNVKKTIVAREDMPEEHRLKQTLPGRTSSRSASARSSAPASSTLIGVGAAKAGPAVMLSFAIAGVICACAALPMPRSRR